MSESALFGLPDVWCASDVAGPLQPIRGKFQYKVALQQRLANGRNGSGSRHSLDSYIAELSAREPVKPAVFLSTVHGAETQARSSQPKAPQTTAGRGGWRRTS
jgi:hypothetical protein